MAKPRLAWSEVKLGDVLQRIRKPVEVQLDTLYREIGVRSHGKGLFYKEARTGKSLGDKSVFWVEPDCFVVNIVFAWEQAVAKTTINENGMIASHRFPMYKPIPDKLDLDYLLYYFHSPRGKYLLGLASPGGAGRNKTLGQQAFQKLSIPLPPILEQHRIATILGTWDTAIALTEQLITAKQRLKKGLMQQLLTGEKRFKQFNSAWETLRFSEIATINPPKAKLIDKIEVSFIAMADVSEEARIIGGTHRQYNEVKQGFTSFQDGDVIVAKITPCFENGKGALVSNLLNGTGFGSTEFIVLRANPSLVDNTYLYYMTLTKEFRTKGRANMVGSAGQQRIQPNFVETFCSGVPTDLEEQQKIVAILRACDTELGLLFSKLTTLRQQKKGLMQKLLTGEVRVKAS